MRMRGAVVWGVAAMCVGVCEVATAEPATVAPTAAVATALDALAHADPHAGLGASTVIANISAATAATAADTIATARAEIAAAPGVKVVDDASRPDELVETIEAANHARITIALDARGGLLRLTANPAHSTFAGSCVPPPSVQHHVDVTSRGTDQSGELREGSTYWGFTTERQSDVDGDGVPDAFVPVAASPDACPEAVSWRVFVIRGGCGYDVGVVGPGTIQAPPDGAALDGALRKLTVVAEKAAIGAHAIPEMTTTTRVFAGAGNGKRSPSYAKLTESSTVGVCYHCATWSCHASSR